MDSLPRAAVVEQLVDAVIAAFLAAPKGYTTGELLSALLTLTNRVLVTLIRQGADASALRQGVERLLLSTAGPKDTVQ